MTRARTHIRAVGISPLIQPLLEAVLCVVVSLVQRVAATFGMRFKHQARDWHTDAMREALPQTMPDIHLKEAPSSTVSFSGLSRESLLENPKGLAISPLETINQDSRDKPENDPVEVATLITVIPAEARQRDLSRRSAAKAEELEPRSHAHRRLHMQPLDSGSRYRASGMTMRAFLKSA